jgi:hypothetical protein
MGCGKSYKEMIAGYKKGKWPALQLQILEIAKRVLTGNRVFDKVLHQPRTIRNG